MKSEQSYTKQTGKQDESNRLQRQVDDYKRRLEDLRTRLYQKEEVAEKLVQRDAEISYLKTLVQRQAETIESLRQRTFGRYLRSIRRLRAWLARAIFKKKSPDESDVNTDGTVSFRLKAQNDLERDISLSGHWHATGKDPYFLLQPSRRRPFRGWYMIELLITGSLPNGMARFYLDTGEGFSEHQSFVVSYRNGQMTKRLHRFDTPPESIRFDPLDSEGIFRVEHLHFAKVPKWFAMNRMIRKIKTVHIDYMGKNETDTRDSIMQKAQEEGLKAEAFAYGLYSECFFTVPAGEGFEYWIENIEKPLFSALEVKLKTQRGLAVAPLISVLVPVYNTDARDLRRCIESVRNQSYPNWELCIADDASTDPTVAEILDSYAQQDDRIKIVYRDSNGHISAASNSALEMATGAFVALLDHDDELAAHALHLVAEAIGKHPDAKILYSDEDKIDDDGQRSDPHFKCRWNPDLLLSQNYISHLGVYKRALMQAVGGFRKGVEGSQDYDLLLRCVARTADGEIVHIPHILYHWRVSEGSTALASGEKSYTTEAGIKALEHFVRLQKINTRVTAGVLPNTYRMTYAISNPQPLVSLLIPTKDQVDVLSRCIASIEEKTTYENVEIIVLDNQSQDAETVEYLASIEKRGRVRVVPYNRPFNFSAINNFGVKQVRGDVIGFVNNDVEVISPQWLTEMVSHAIRPGRGCVGAKLYYPDGRIQHAGVVLGIGGVAAHSHKYFQKSSYGYFSRLLLVQNISAVTAACLVVRKDIFEQVGGFDEENLAIAFNDVDLCLKVQAAGYRNVWTPYAELIHHESVSRGGEDSAEKIERFSRETRFMKTKWKEILADDPYYSPHLSRIKEDFSIG